MALLLALAISGITLVSIYYFFPSSGYWFPPYISEYGEAYDKHFMLTLIICGVIFFLAQIALAYTVFRYRGTPGGKAQYLLGNPKLELLWTSAAAVLFVGLVLGGHSIWIRAHLENAPAGSLQVEVWAQQFTWYMRYPGPDGKFGRTVPELMKESTGNPLGIDPEDPASKDDFVMPTLAVPVNRPVEVILRSKDVIHSFAVRELRLKQDVVPGLENRLHFTASKVGDYEIPCMEICGLGHYQMRSLLQVKSDADFSEWVREATAPQ
jgi:cytochrome c oxidase subunit 2